MTWPKQDTDTDSSSWQSVERLARLALHLVPGVGPRVGRSLLNRAGSAVALFAMDPKQLEDVEGVGPALIKRLKLAAQGDALRRELALLEKHDAVFHTCIDPDYPEPLLKYDDSPLVLYEIGGRIPQDKQAVAIVGSRGCTPYGLRMTKRIATGLAEAGFTVISGLARGIDAKAHEAALETGGRTIAVLGNGLSRVYPAEHADLARRVVEQGSLMAEADMAQAPQPGLFPARNRIISGISRAVIVVEAAAKSGTLHTATHAAEQGVPVMAVPGPADSPLCEGTHQLLRSGAHLCTGIDDVVQLLGEPNRPTRQPLQPQSAEPVHDPDQQKLWRALAQGPRFADELVRETGFPIAKLSMLTLLMETTGLIRRLPGNRFEIPD